jgi:hypothetical protein
MEYRHGFNTGRLIGENGQPYNIADALNRSITPFNEIRVAQRFPQLALNAGIPLSNRRDFIDVDDGTVEAVNGMYRIRANVGGRAGLYSRQRGQYVSGGEVEGGIGLVFPTLPTGDAQIQWGFEDYFGDNALRFNYKSDGLYIELVSSGELKLSINQDDWNVDRLDGTGPSKYELDVTNGHAYQLPFVYYGFGDITFQVMVELEGKQRVVDVHRVRRKGVISIAQPNLPLFIKCIADDVQLDAFLGGRQISSTMRSMEVARTVGAVRINQSVSTTFVPLISFEHKDNFESILVKLSGLFIATQDDLILEIRRNPTLTGSTFEYIGNYVESERATKWDVAATALTGGETIWVGAAVGGVGNQKNSASVDFPERPISELDTITLCARSIKGSSTTTSILRVTEEW